jgi:hypothetical protein
MAYKWKGSHELSLIRSDKKPKQNYNLVKSRFVIFRVYFFIPEDVKELLLGWNELNFWISNFKNLIVFTGRLYTEGDLNGNKNLLKTWKYFRKM